jgi:hypothetical protein
MSDPVIAPFGRPVHVGYFFRDTYAYGQSAAPGNVTVIVGEARAALTAEPCAEDGLPIGRIIGPDAIETMAETPEWWAHVVAIYLAGELSDDPVACIARKREMCLGMFQALGVPPRPFITYTGALTYTALSREDTWLGVQLYLTGTQGPERLINAAAGARYALAGMPVVVFAQAYDRRGPNGPQYTGDLAELQPVYAEIVRQWPDVRALLWFSDGRPGGTRDHEEMRPWHRAIAAAARR